eukprot:gene449-486_t
MDEIQPLALEECPVVEPPCPASIYAMKKIPPSYIWSALDHPLILRTRSAKLSNVSLVGKVAGWSDQRLDWNESPSSFPSCFPYFVRGRDSTRKYINQLFKSEIVMYDGAMATMIQEEGSWLTEEAFRGERFANWPCNVKGNYDLLNLTQAQVIKNIYLQYMRSGSRLIGTNTFCSTAIAQSTFGMESLTYEMNYASARLAREAANEITALDPTKPRFVVGAIGPTSRTASIPSKAEDPSVRNVTFDELVTAYYEQVVALVDGGVDMLIVETIFDCLNAKAAFYAIGEYLEHAKVDIPLIASVTLIDSSGRTPSGQTPEAFYASIRHAKPICVGLNCSLGTKQMVPFVKRLVACAECYVHVYSNAGLPNATGGYDETPQIMAKYYEEFFKNGWLNMVGGCCGSTPSHIAAIKTLIDTYNYKPRALLSDSPSSMWLCGLNDLLIEDIDDHFETMLWSESERCSDSMNSIQSHRLYGTDRIDEVVNISKRQITRDSHVIEIIVNDQTILGLAAMTYVKVAVADPVLAINPFMLSAPKFEILLAGLKWCPGKPIINNISLNLGEKTFKQYATLLRKHGAAVVVLAADEIIGGTLYREKVRVCKQSYNILVNEVGFPAEDILFDLNISIGMEERDNDGTSFFETINLVKELCPDAKATGRINAV